MSFPVDGSGDRGVFGSPLPLPLTLCAQASPAAAAVASALPRADLAKVAAVAFPKGGSSGPLQHPPPPPSFFSGGSDIPMVAASRADPAAMATLAAPAGRSGGGDIGDGVILGPKRGELALDASA
ncbi:hypothetical protein OsI_07197 [Oryza sativa Indica Group]|uniref:Uncharacterized protein n=1 Tax=Oryza sativa subsp. indica TaxID=39946 RepID=A2X4S5_ORYSI|nr:hypothetical protein OsI_07197 [Oryza sativa Indica Group]